MLSVGLQLSLAGCLLALEDLKIVGVRDRHHKSPVMTLQIASHLLSYSNLCWTSGQQCGSGFVLGIAWIYQLLNAYPQGWIMDS